MAKRISLSFLLVFALVIGIFAIPVSAENSAPVAENFEFETYRGVSFGAQLSALDPEGDTLSFEITTEPVKGTVTLSEDGSFVYTPEKGKKGKDYFGYKAVDSEGNYSQEATVIIRLIKQSTDVSYADMAGSASHCSAVSLAECGAFVGKQVCGEYYFEPQRSVSRGEFLSLCLAVADTDLLSGVVSTGFTDDESIPDWLKSCISTAVKCGIVKGYSGAEGAYFDADAEITRAEAMVMLNKTLSLSDVSYLDVDDTVPQFAIQSAANLAACNVIGSTALSASPLTRAEAADMLAAAMNIVNKR